MDAKDLEKKDMIGHGAFASVFRANYKNGQEVIVQSILTVESIERLDSHSSVIIIQRFPIINFTNLRF